MRLNPRIENLRIVLVRFLSSFETSYIVIDGIDRFIGSDELSGLFDVLLGLT